MKRHLMFIPAILLCLLAGSCGNGGELTSSQPQPTGNGIVTAGETSGEVVAQNGDFSLKALSSSYEFGGSAEYKMVITEEPGTVEVAVQVTATDLRAAMLQLNYDAKKLHPVSSHEGEWPQLSTDNSLSLLVMDQPGAIHYGKSVVRPNEHPGVTGGFDVLRIRFAEGADSPVRTIAAVPVGDDSSIPNFIADFVTGNLAFSYYNVGDYNQDSLVGVSDLTPLGIHYGELVPADPESIGAVIDGNHNGLIEVGDITPIGQNYGRIVTLWRVYGGDAADYPTAHDEDNGSATVYGNVNFADSISLPWEERLRFTSNIAGLVGFADEALWLRPLGDETDEGIASNIVEFGVDVTPPDWTDTVGITSALSGIGQITVGWGEAVDSESPPVIYVVYYDEAADPNFLTAPSVEVAAPLQSVVVDNLTDGVEYAVMVRAKDSAPTPNEDDNTTLLMVTPGTDLTPPDWTYQPDGIVEVIPLDGGARVMWGEATDADSPPVTYVVYYNEGTVVDFATASTMEVAAIDPPDPQDNSDRIREVAGLPNDTEYAFAVRARDSAPALNEDANTNTLTVTPLAEAEVPAAITEETTFNGPMKISGGSTVTVTGGECLIFLGDLVIEEGATLVGVDADLCVQVFGNFICNGTVDIQLPGEVPEDTDTDSMKLVLKGRVDFGETSLVTGNGNIYLVDDLEELLTPEEVEIETDNDTNPEDYPFNWMPEEEGVGASKAPVSVHKTTSRVVYYGPRPWQYWIVRGNWGRIPAQPRRVRRVVFRCAPVNGELHFQNFSIEGPPGQDGASKTGGCNLVGDDGEDNRFRLRVHCGRTMTFNNVNIKLGDGGRGGDATTDMDCKPGFAQGGKGGKPKNKFRFSAGAGGGIHAVGAFNFNPGNGGDGGDALAYGANGEDGCPAEDGWAATAIGGEGGEVPRWGMRVRGNVTGLSNMVLGVAEGGGGGSGGSMAGDGGNDTCCPGEVGGTGGAASATGGLGGDSVFSGAPSATGGGGARSGDGGFTIAWGGNGGNGASCGKLPGGDGGAGGTADATGGDPGTATGSGGNITQGNQGSADAIGGDGGDGGDGWGPGVGGAGGIATATGNPGTATDGEDGDDGEVDLAAFSHHQVPPASPSPVPAPIPPGEYPEPIYDAEDGYREVGGILVGLDAGPTGTYEVIEYGPGEMALRVMGECMITYDKSKTIAYEGQDADWIGLDLTTTLAFTEATGTLFVRFYLGGIPVGEFPINTNMSGADTTEQFMVEPSGSWDVMVIESPMDGFMEITDVIIIDP